MEEDRNYYHEIGLGGGGSDFGIITTTEEEKEWMEKRGFQSDHTATIGTAVFPFASRENAHRFGKPDLHKEMADAGFTNEGVFDNAAMKKLTEQGENK